MLQTEAQLGLPFPLLMHASHQILKSRGSNPPYPQLKLRLLLYFCSQHTNCDQYLVAMNHELEICLMDLVCAFLHPLDPLHVHKEKDQNMVYLLCNRRMIYDGKKPD